MAVSYSRRFLHFALALSLAFAGFVVPQASAAASTFIGGPVDEPLYVANDHTAFGFRYGAGTDSGLDPSTTYYVKVRFTEGTSPSPSTNRGYTWNPTTQTWIQESDDWSTFPTVNTNADSSITTQWLFAKFGDDALTGEYHLMVSLQPVGVSTTYNSTLLPLVQVLDMKTQGSWVHNGTATAQSAKRAETVVYDAGLDAHFIASLSKTEPNLIDDDSNGIVDDEDSGPAGVSGDYRLHVPMSATVDILLQSSIAHDDYVTGAADTDIAVGAGDQTPPSKPGTPEISVADDSATISWAGSTDSGGSGLAGYHVYRWAERPDGQKFSPIHQRIATVGAAVTEYTDTGLADGVVYNYEVRAFDGDTNVSSRSTTISTAGDDEPEPPVDPIETQIVRSGGSDRYATALAISRNNFVADSVVTAVIATGRDFPDALAASALAGVYDSPVLLVDATVSSGLTAELKRLGATRVCLIGGPAAIPDAIATTLGTAGFTVERVSGSDRYQTAARVAARVKALTGATPEAFFVRGDDFADALSCAPYAYAGKIPVLLVASDAVPAATAGAISSLRIVDGHVIGGTAAVAPATYSTLDTLLTGSIGRTAGSNRYATAAAVVEHALQNAWADAGYVGIATGVSFADALGGGAAAGTNRGVMLLTGAAALDPSAAAILSANKVDIQIVEIYGGVAAVSDNVKVAITNIIE
jgi:putative cell wall-binding protein